MSPSNDKILAHFDEFEPSLKKELVKTGEVISFKKGDEILQNGQHYSGNLLVLNGLVKVFRRDENGNEIFLFFVVPGEAIYLSVLNADNINKSELIAIAADQTQALSIPYNTMDDLIPRFKTWYKFVAQTYRGRFEKLFKSLDYYAFRGLDDRLSHYLLKRFNILKSADLRVSHQEIAHDLNSSREVISRALKKMENKGKLRLKRNLIQLLNTEELSANTDT